MNRRNVIRALTLAAVAAPVVAARELIKRDPEPLPLAASGTPLMASTWNALVARVNELSEQA